MRCEKILILGLGGMGRYLASRLCLDGHQVTVIEPDRDKLQRAEGELDARLIHGDATDFDCWAEAEANGLRHRGHRR